MTLGVKLGFYLWILWTVKLVASWKPWVLLMTELWLASKSPILHVVMRLLRHVFWDEMQVTLVSFAGWRLIVHVLHLLKPNLLPHVEVVIVIYLDGFYDSFNHV